MHKSAHRLGAESSPYLQQHADNPVEWYPWGEEALQVAREENRPILLSIGYSACHWCHVMAHESFEDQATAELMNRHFVNIKVDREERPDLDRIYQTAHQLLTQRPGGWPLTMFLTHDGQVPFFGGTYFPDSARHGMPAFRDILQQIADFYTSKREEIVRQSEAVLEVFQRLETQTASESQGLNAAPLTAARKELGKQFDERDGGFGGAPKFPHPTHLERLLRHWDASVRIGAEDGHARHMALFTLHRMCDGGLYDQLGGGFCRYSVDAHWAIPHFEKMLYDNGPLLALTAQAAAVSSEPRFANVARQTGAWVIREMQAPEGGYFSTLDADSEGEEGRFYVWTPERFQSLLTVQEFAIARRVFGLDRPANFEGYWHLYRASEPADAAAAAGLEGIDPDAVFASAAAKLFAARERRERPGLDEKILTAWNGLMVRGMAIAARSLVEPAFAQSATRAVDFLRETMWRDGRLLATARDGKARLTAYLDDYAFLADGLVELLQCRWRQSDLDFAVALAESMLAHFEDGARGGFFFTADDHETLIHRPKTYADEATPAGNGIAATVLGRLGHLLGRNDFIDAAERTLGSAQEALSQFAYAHASLLIALEELLEPPAIVIVRAAEEDCGPWREAVAGYEPRQLAFFIPADATGLPPALALREPRGDAVAYVCRGQTCSTPIDTPQALREALG